MYLVVVQNGFRLPRRIMLLLVLRIILVPKLKLHCHMVVQDVERLYLHGESIRCGTTVDGIKSGNKQKFEFVHALNRL